MRMPPSAWPPQAGCCEGRSRQLVPQPGLQGLPDLGSGSCSTLLDRTFQLKWENQPHLSGGRSEALQAVREHQAAQGRVSDGEFSPRRQCGMRGGKHECSDRWWPNGTGSEAAPATWSPLHPLCGCAQGETAGLREVCSLETSFLSILVPSTLLCQGPLSPPCRGGVQRGFQTDTNCGWKKHAPPLIKIPTSSPGPVPGVPGLVAVEMIMWVFCRYFPLLQKV